MNKLVIVSTILLVLGLTLSLCTRADAGDLFEEYLWKNRLVLIYAPRSDDERLTQQIEIFENVSDGIKERDIVLWRFVYLDSVNKDGEYLVHLSTNPFYEEFDIGIKEFAVILIGKDGEVKRRENGVLSAKTLFETIDAMPMRQREMRK